MDVIQGAIAAAQEGTSATTSGRPLRCCDASIGRTEAAIRGPGGTGHPSVPLRLLLGRHGAARRNAAIRPTAAMQARVTRLRHVIGSMVKEYPDLQKIEDKLSKGFASQDVQSEWRKVHIPAVLIHVQNGEKLLSFLDTTTIKIPHMGEH